ncbi:MAG: aminotransferase class IV [Boseongicola sp. SB0677_bin_26]|nr:aminotransferase class IV [Boseongicola sp. SB0665_bin_10]MYG28602.1 aminotransferase class IV [Boseongicola sp. SB0677_bin_26]
MAGSQHFVADPRNETARIYLNGEFVPREQALVSIFDAGWILGDGVWEGFRMHGGRLAFMDLHLDRLFMGARAVDMDIGMTRDEVRSALEATLERNGMTGQSGVHVRLMITRGLKKSPNQDPRNTVSGPTVAIVAEYKEPDPELLNTGLSLFTSAIRTCRADMFDMTLNTHSRLNYIMALNQAIKAGADEALMLDDRGFVATCNATNFFAVRNRRVLTSTGANCFNGITRANIIALCDSHGIYCEQKDFTLAQVYDADEAFVTGTFGGLTPVRMVDGHPMPSVMGPISSMLREAYLEYAATCT